MTDDYSALVLLEEAYVRVCRTEEILMDVNVIGKKINRKKVADLFVRTKKLGKDISAYISELEHAQEDYEESCPCVREGRKTLCDEGSARYNETYD